MLSDESQDQFMHGLQQSLNRTLVDVGVYLDYSSREGRTFFPLAMVFPYPADFFDEHTAEGAYVLNRAISGFSRMISEFVSESYATPNEIAVVGLHKEIEIVDEPPYFEAVCGDLSEGFSAMAIMIYVRFLSSELHLVPYSFGLTRHRNEELDLMDHQLNKPTFNPEE